MTDLPDTAAQARLAETFAEVEDALLSRWPETKLDPSLDRIRAFTEILGDPQTSYPVIQLTGTNGKTSTSRMIDALLRALDLRTGRFTTPPPCERGDRRISVDSEPLADDEFFVGRVQRRARRTRTSWTRAREHPLSFFETIVGMAYARFAEAPVDVAVVEVGMGGSWDATNVADAAVAVVLPVRDRPRQVPRGHTCRDRRREGRDHQGRAASPSSPSSRSTLPRWSWPTPRRSAPPSSARGWSSGSWPARPPSAARCFRFRACGRGYDDVFLPLYGAHQAQNAAVALAAVESFLSGGEVLDDELVRAAFAEVTSPARLEIVRRSPTVLLDAAHNPHGAEAAAAALDDSFVFSPLIGVIGVMGDKDAEGLLAAFEPHLAHVVCTQNSTARAMPAETLAVTAREVFGDHRVTVEPRLADAIDQAAALAEAGEAVGESIGSGAVLVTGSVVTAGEARTLLRPASGRRP